MFYVPADQYAGMYALFRDITPSFSLKKISRLADDLFCNCRYNIK